MPRSYDAMATPCSGRTDLFYSDSFEDQAAAKALCRGCELQTLCLNQALRRERSDRHGILGGLDPIERGFYHKLYGVPDRIMDLPERYRTKPKKPKGKAAAA